MERTGRGPLGAQVRHSNFERPSPSSFLFFPFLSHSLSFSLLRLRCCLGFTAYLCCYSSLHQSFQFHLLLTHLNSFNPHLAYTSIVRLVFAVEEALGRKILAEVVQSDFPRQNSSFCWWRYKLWGFHTTRHLKRRLSISILFPGGFETDKR